jgi:putative zincin peptidase
MSVARANALALLWLPLSAALVLLPFFTLWGSGRLAEAPPRIPPALWSVALMLAAVLVHELLHAAGFLLFGRAPRGEVRLGFQPRTLTPFASCRVPVRAAAYRVAGLLPALVLGGLPVLAAWATGSGTLLLWGWLMLALAGGDVAAVWAMRNVPGDAMVVDDAARVGCRVV